MISLYVFYRKIVPPHKRPADSVITYPIGRVREVNLHTVNVAYRQLRKHEQNAASFQEKLNAHSISQTN